MKHIWVVGGDPRQAALAAALEEDGHEVHTFAMGRKEDTLAGIDRADCVILPLPAMDGCVANTELPPHSWNVIRFAKKAE